MTVSRRQGSSPCIEFFVSLFVGSVAILGGLFIIGFLLVEPVRHPPGQRAQTVDINDLLGSCEPTLQTRLLPYGCTYNNQPSIEKSVCSAQECDCDPEQNGNVCCCQSLISEPVSNIVCPVGVVPPILGNTTVCGCGVCDDVSLQVHITVVNRDTDEPISAAVVMRNDGEEDYNILGVTNHHGRYMYTEKVGRVYLELKIIAKGYMSQTTLPMRLHPFRHVIELRIVMIPKMTIDVGLGGSDIVVRLGTLATVSAPAGSFYSEDTSYDDLVQFQGMFVTPSDVNGLTGVPGAQFNVLNKATGERETMGVVFSTWLGFMGSDGQSLTNEELIMQISVPSSDASNLYLIVYNETSYEWEKYSDFRPIQESRRKRQNSNTPIILENQNTPLGVFAAVANNVAVNCWLQGRTFDSNGAPVSNRFITVEETLPRGGVPRLIRFGTNTGAHSSLATNALCLPVDCGTALSATVSARELFDSQSAPLAPQPLPAEAFDINENAPIRFGSVFSFEEVILSTSSRVRPFYSSQSDCVASATSITPSNSSFFGFQESVITAPMGSDSCSIKIQILDCFIDNSVTITSVNVDTGTIDGSVTISITEPPEMMMPTGSGTMPPEVTTEAGTPVCDASTATLRGACLPYVCGDNVQLLVRQNADSGSSGFCTITGRSVFLSNSLLSDTSNAQQLILRTGSLVSGDFNNPEFGLYHVPGNNMMAADLSTEMCNAGTGNGDTSAEIDVTTGAAVEFSCF